MMQPTVRLVRLRPDAASLSRAMRRDSELHSSGQSGDGRREDRRGGGADTEMTDLVEHGARSTGASTGAPPFLDLFDEAAPPGVSSVEALPADLSAETPPPSDLSLEVQAGDPSTRRDPSIVLPPSGKATAAAIEKLKRATLLREESSVRYDPSLDDEFAELATPPPPSAQPPSRVDASGATSVAFHNSFLCFVELNRVSDSPELNDKRSCAQTDGGGGAAETLDFVDRLLAEAEGGYTSADGKPTLNAADTARMEGESNDVAETPPDAAEAKSGATERKQTKNEKRGVAAVAGKADDASGGKPEQSGCEEEPEREVTAGKADDAPGGGSEEEPEREVTAGKADDASGGGSEEVTAGKADDASGGGSEEEPEREEEEEPEREEAAAAAAGCSAEQDIESLLDLEWQMARLQHEADALKEKERCRATAKKPKRRQTGKRRQTRKSWSQRDSDSDDVWQRESSDRLTGDADDLSLSEESESDNWSPCAKKKKGTGESHSRGHCKRAKRACRAESAPKRVLSARKCKMAVQQKQEQRKRKGSIEDDDADDTVGDTGDGLNYNEPEAETLVKSPDRDPDWVMQTAAERSEEEAEADEDVKMKSDSESEFSDGKRKPKQQHGRQSAAKSKKKRRSTVPAQQPTEDAFIKKFKKGSFIVLKSDADSPDCTLWRVEGDILHKFLPCDDRPKGFYKGTPSYSCWPDTSPSSYKDVKVKILKQTPSCINMVIEAVEDFYTQELPTLTDADTLALEANPLRDTFTVYTQILLSQVLDHSFLLEVRKENDEYFLTTLKKVEAIANDKKTLMQKKVNWSNSNYEGALAAHPYFAQTPGDNPLEPCQACKVISRPASRYIELYGNTYKKDTFLPLTFQKPPQKFHMCTICTDLSEVLHSLTHIHYRLFRHCLDKVEGLKEENPNVEPREILETCLQNRVWVNQIFQELVSLVDKFERKYL
ncbi:PREDICTED: uncharacterized protein LOC106807576 [Priapulus caudatus]|uniref:Uncharacterized protein LOC106807576 n=1 Tax=Priapulus caudatus TaxID=37621 RepID=A0ABM1DZR9_PRICU|nr:PREDICTED: uncharacterized protein LOC106807576 [Priapulus caudatus]